MSVLYDAGALIAAERNVRAIWADHRARLEAGSVPVTTAPVVAQVSRNAPQVQLRRFLRGCETLGFLSTEGHEVGSLLARTGAADVVDAHVVLVASRRGCPVLTSDPADLVELSQLLSPAVEIRVV